MISKVIVLAEGEEVITIVRRHWYSLAVEGFLDIFIFTFMAGSVVVTDAVLLQGESGVQSGTVVPLGFFVVGFAGLFLWMHFFASWSDHWLDAWIITNNRIIDIEQKGFFNREVSSFPLDKIQDITYTIAGIIPTWLHFGDIRIQTASISEDFIMRQVPFPEDIKEHLVAVIENTKTKSLS
jgi:hypothetical protein